MLASVLFAALTFLSPQVHTKTAPPCRPLTQAQMGQPLTLSESCYVVNSYATAKAPIIVQPGVTVIFGPGAGLILESGASLNAVGTAEKPIFFRGKENVPGFWNGIQFSTNSAKNRLSFVTVEDGAGYGGANDADVVVSIGARLAIDHTTLRKSKRYGLFADQNATISEFMANRFEQNDIPLSVKAGDLAALDAATTFGENKNNWVLVHFSDSTVTENATWHALAVPYRFQGSPTIKAAVTVEAGARLEFAQSFGIHVELGGSLTTEGTAGKPVVLTGAEEAPGFWDGITFSSNSPHNVIRNTVITYAGMKGGLSNAGIALSPRASVTVQSSEIAFSPTAAIYVGQDAQLNADATTSNRLHDNAQGIAH